MERITLLESIDKLSEVERKTRETTDARIQEWQKQIKVRDCFRQSTPYGFNIYGEVLEECRATHLENYRFCHCYSITYPIGKKLNVHISQMNELIDRKTFEVMKKWLTEGIKKGLF